MAINPKTLIAQLIITDKSSGIKYVSVHEEQKYSCSGCAFSLTDDICLADYVINNIDCATTKRIFKEVEKD